MNRVTEHLSHARSLVMVRTATEGELRLMATDMNRYLPETVHAFSAAVH